LAKKPNSDAVKDQQLYLFDFSRCRCTDTLFWSSEGNIDFEAVVGQQWFLGPTGTATFELDDADVVEIREIQVYLLVVPVYQFGCLSDTLRFVLEDRFQ
jgi:hypothetical protein